MNTQESTPSRKIPEEGGSTTKVKRLNKNEPKNNQSKTRNLTPNEKKKGVQMKLPHILTCHFSVCLKRSNN
jgi:hypothetical protein